MSIESCHPTISSSVVPFSFRLQSSPASGSFPMSQFFTSGGQSIGVSAYASVLSMNIQDWFPLGSPRDSQESSPTPQLKSINSLVLSFLHSPTLTSIHDVNIMICYFCTLRNGHCKKSSYSSSPSYLQIFFLMRKIFKMYFLSNFQVWSIVLLSIVSMLYMTSPRLMNFITGCLYPLTLFNHFAHPLPFPKHLEDHSLSSSCSVVSNSLRPHGL